jgi:nucleotide-binding universal stress UspA family protein
MTIVCGTDLTPSAARAARAAAAIAQRLQVPLKLVHVLDELGADVTVKQQGEAAFADRRGRLRAQADQLGQDFAIEVLPIAIPGRADTELVRIAIESHATLVVVAAAGRTLRHRWLLGSIAEQVARRSPIAVLVVRDEINLVAWARGERPLDVVIGCDPSSYSEVAVEWAARLRKIGACDLSVVQLVTPADEHARLGVGRVSAKEPLSPEIEQVLLRDLRASIGTLPGPGKTTVKVLARTEELDMQLAHLAESADLLVVGTHQRSGIERWWHGSVSRGVLKHASTSVACVPRTESQARPERAIRRLLVPTDFSSVSNRAIAVAYALAPPDGIVHLVHVARHPGARIGDLEQALRDLVPPASVGVVATEVEIIDSDDPATAIVQAAARLGADLVCMATHGRSNLSGLVLGSQAQRVVATAGQPIVLVPQERAS